MNEAELRRTSMCMCGHPMAAHGRPYNENDAQCKATITAAMTAFSSYSYPCECQNFDPIPAQRPTRPVPDPHRDRPPKPRPPEPDSGRHYPTLREDFQAWRRRRRNRRLLRSTAAR